MNVDLGSLAEWAGAVAASFAAGFGWGALRLAKHANNTAEESLARQLLRERSGVARQLQAWWVTWTDDSHGRDCYGVLVSNGGDGTTVFRSVEVETTGNSLATARGAQGSIKIETLPPGAYLVQSPPRTPGGAPWMEPQTVVDIRDFRPLLRARQWGVTRIGFTDPVGTRWEWTPSASLREVETA